MKYTYKRREISNISSLLYKRGLISGGEGNISIRLEGSNVLITPKGVHKGFLLPEKCALVDLSGKVLSGPEPSSELFLHLETYRKNPNLSAIVHAHPPWTTALYLSGKGIDNPPILAEVIHAIGKVAVVPYYRPGSSELAKGVSNALMESRACVLLNHGVVTCGKTLMDAFMLIECIENCAKITALGYMLGEPMPIG